MMWVGIIIWRDEGRLHSTGLIPSLGSWNCAVQRLKTVFLMEASQMHQ